MPIYGEFGTIIRISECFGILYKRRFCCSVTHILEILLFVVCKSNLRGMGFRSLIVSAGGSSEDSGSALLDLCSWELCFS